MLEFPELRVAESLQYRILQTTGEDFCTTVKRAQRRGYRLPLAQELLCFGSDEYISNQKFERMREVVQAGGWWLDVAAQREGDLVTLHENPQGIEYCTKHRDYTARTFQSANTFTTRVRPEADVVQLAELDDAFLLHLLGVSRQEIVERAHSWFKQLGTRFPTILDNFVVLPYEGQPPQPVCVDFCGKEFRIEMTNRYAAAAIGVRQT